MAWGFKTGDVTSCRATTRAGSFVAGRAKRIRSYDAISSITTSSTASMRCSTCSKRAATFLLSSNATTRANVATARKGAGGRGAKHDRARAGEFRAADVAFIREDEGREPRVYGLLRRRW